MSAKAIIKKSILESDMYNQSISLSTLMTIMFDMAIAIIIGVLIYEVYKKYYNGVVYSRTFAYTLIGMTVLTCMVTLAISTNIVISLGMVGALSIVRYRAAVKEPLDIMYLFWAITMGITVGASMYLLAAVGMLAMLVIIMVMNRKREKSICYMLIVHLAGDGDGGSRSDVEEKVRSLLKNTIFRIRSKVSRETDSELVMEIEAAEKDLAVTEKIRELPGVKDVTLVSYNGEYHSS